MSLAQNKYHEEQVSETYRSIIQTFSSQRSLELMNELISRVERVRDDINPLLPIDRIKSCHCSMDKKIKGAIENVVYGFGYILFIFSPSQTWAANRPYKHSKSVLQLLK